MGWIFPVEKFLGGSVTSIFSFFIFASIDVFSMMFFFFNNSLSRKFFKIFNFCPLSFLSSTDNNEGTEIYIYWKESKQYSKISQLEKSPNGFKDCKVEFSKNLCNYDKENGFLKRITVTGNSIEEIISNGENYDLKYIVTNEKENEFRGFVDKIYSNEEKYPYLKKIFDSELENYEKLKIKIFEINYTKFNTFIKD